MIFNQVAFMNYRYIGHKNITSRSKWRAPSSLPVLSDPIIMYVESAESSDRNPGQFWPGTEYDPQMDPFPGHADPVAFRM